jgi:hypothetical protein
MNNEGLENTSVVPGTPETPVTPEAASTPVETETPGILFLILSNNSK